MFDAYDALNAESEPAVALLVEAGKARACAEFREASALLEVVRLKHRACAAITDRETRKLAEDAAFDEIGLHLRVPGRSLQHHYVAVHRLATRLPACWEAWRHGLIDQRRAFAIARQSMGLRFDDSLAQLDRLAADYAPDHTYGALWSWLAKRIEKIEPAQAAHRHTEAKKQRRVRVFHEADGMSWINAYVPTTDVFCIDKALERQARTSKAAGDARTLQQLRADQFVDLLRGRSASTEPGEAIGYRINVIVPLLSLVGLSDAPGESLDGKVALPAALIRELAAEPGTVFSRIITDPVGNLLAVDQKTYAFTGRQRDAIDLRDGTCRFPTCQQPADLCDKDHVIPWPRGSTTASNAASLCRRHHRLKTAGLLRLEKDGRALSMNVGAIRRHLIDTRSFTGIELRYQPDDAAA